MARLTCCTLLSLALLSTGCQYFRAQEDPGEVADVPPPPAQAYNGGFDAGPGPEPMPEQPSAAGSAYEPAPAAGATAAAAPPAAPQQPAGQTYTIRKGDTLWSIAKQHYGNGQMWVEIAEANPSVDPQRLIVGSTITLP